MFYALIALCLFGGASAQLYGLWKCPDIVKPMTNFEPKRIEGRWYKIRRYPMFFTLLSQCPWVDYKMVDKSVDHFVVSHGAYYAKQHIKMELGGEAHAPEKLESGKQTTTFILDSIKRDYWVLDVVYDKWLVVYSCRSFFIFFHWKYVFILTRNPSPPNDVLSDAEAVLDRNKLQTAKLQTVDRTGCSEVDAEKPDD